VTRGCVASLFFVTALAGLHAFGARPPSADVVVVWSITNPQSPVPETLAIDVARELKRSAASRGLTFQIKTITGRSFPKAFRDARASHAEPDVLVFTSMTVLKGLPARHSMGPLDGIDDDPEIAASLVKVSETLDGLRTLTRGHSARAWKYLVTTSPHHEAARVLATPPIACNAPNTLAGASQVAQRAVSALLTQDEEALNELSTTGRYPDDALPMERPKHVLGHVIPPPHRLVLDAKACDVWGNERFAVVDVTALIQGDSEIGDEHVTVVVVGVSGSPAVLGVGRSRNLPDALHDRHLRAAPALPKTLPSLDVIGPPDRSAHGRTPVGNRPTLEWRRPSDGGSFVYFVEAQDGEPRLSDQPERWVNNTFYPLVRERGEISLHPSIVRTPAPFGSYYPNRWRIWAIDRDGNLSRSDWRILFWNK